MLHIINKSMLTNKRAFSLIETMFVCIICGSIFFGSIWVVNAMVWRWWNETAPLIEAQRAARSAVDSIIIGRPDPTTGTYTLDPNNPDLTSIARWNGIAWAMWVRGPANTTLTPRVSIDSKQIDYKLEPDSTSFARSFYYGTSDGYGYVYYKDSDGVSHQIKTTKGITSLEVTKTEPIDDDKNILGAIVKVTATVEKTIQGTRLKKPYTIKVEYSDSVFLRNRQYYEE